MFNTIRNGASNTCTMLHTSCIIIISVYVQLTARFLCADDGAIVTAACVTSIHAHELFPVDVFCVVVHASCNTTVNLRFRSVPTRTHSNT